MMARTKRSRRSYSAGEWGRNRVRVFPDPKTGRYQIEWRENGRRLTRSLKHRDWSRAKRQADEVAAGFAVHESNGQTEAEPEPLTLGTLLDIYGDEVTPTKSERSRRYDRVAMKMFVKVFGRHRKPATLSQRDWDRFIRARRAGKVGPSKLKGRCPTVRSNTTLDSCSQSSTGPPSRGTRKDGSSSNPIPLRGLKLPKEKNPRPA